MKFDEFAIVEKKRRKRKPCWAAYGPGPFGGYGFAAGYSGAGGGDGGVGEASYEGNIGMMEVAKFFKIANEAQKKLFKELLEKGKRGLAWKLIQDVTDTKLQGKEFEVSEGFQQRTIDKLSGLRLQGPYQKKELVAMNSAWRKILSDISSSAQVMVQDSGNPRHSAWISPEGGGRWMVGAEDGYTIKSGPSALQQLQFFLRTDEGWRDTLAGLALGGAVAMGGAQAKGVDPGEKYHGYSEPIQLIQKVEKGDTVYSLAREFGVTPRDIQRVNKLDKNFTIKPGQELAIPKQSKPAEIEYKKSDKPVSTKGKLLYNNADEQRLLSVLISNGFRGAELAAFMAQAAHETRNFESMVEEGSPRYFMRYDPSSKNPKHKESANNLGNTKAGDGARFKGRGHLQITGRWNYGAVGRLIGVNLIKNPELLENPDIGIKASIAFWKMRVQPNVTDYNNVRQVTRPINKGLDKLAQRKEKFKNYKILLAKR